MVITVEAAVTAEKTNMCIAYSTQSEESTWCENHVREAFFCSVVRKMWKMEIIVVMTVVYKEHLCCHKQKINK